VIQRDRCGQLWISDKKIAVLIQAENKLEGGIAGKCQRLERLSPVRDYQADT